MKEAIVSKIPVQCPWRDTLHWYDTVDSTNTQAKALAQAGAPHGTVLVAGQQTGGRGRMGRSFQSPGGEGVYLSVILRPGCRPSELMHLTCAVGVAVAQAIESIAGIRVGLKWINDLVWQKRKLGGILTELSVNPKTGLVDFAVVGVGINCRQTAGDFPPEIAEIATSIAIAAGKPAAPADLAAAMVLQLWQLSSRLLTQKHLLMEDYRSRCITLGQHVMVLRGQQRRPCRAADLDDNGGLVVCYDDGSQETVSSGEVSVRGFYDYV